MHHGWYNSEFMTTFIWKKCTLNVIKKMCWTAIITRDLIKTSTIVASIWKRSFLLAAMYVEKTAFTCVGFKHRKHHPKKKKKNFHRIWSLQLVEFCSVLSGKFLQVKKPSGLTYQRCIYTKGLKNAYATSCTKNLVLQKNKNKINGEKYV